MSKTYYATREVSESEKAGIKRMKKRVKDFKNQVVRLHTADFDKALRVSMESERPVRIR